MYVNQVVFFEISCNRYVGMYLEVVLKNTTSKHKLTLLTLNFDRFYIKPYILLN